MKLSLLSGILLLTGMLWNAAAQPVPTGKKLTLALEADEYWWGGFVSEGHLLPFREGNFGGNFYAENKNNQAQPLLLSNHGRFIWSEQPFAFEFKNHTLDISSAFDSVYRGKRGSTLAEAYRYVSKQFFPADGKMPDELLFSQPQWNTWIELTYHQNQQDILQYAKAIIDNGFSPGVLMIDDTWQEDYGMWNFHPGRFTNPKAMMDELHRMGFKVMLWICPFVSGDSPAYRDLKSKKALLLEGNGDQSLTWKEAKTEPAMIRWWNGASALLDFTNPAGVTWFKEQLHALQQQYGVDGFKLDAGDTNFYSDSTLVAYQKVLPNRHTELFGQFGLEYPLNEYRAMWKMAGKPLAQRLWDKSHSWEDLQKLLPQVILQGIEGYAFACPDMIGGGEFSSFLSLKTIDQDLIVRSAQCHALMPMMQFSVAPWRVLDDKHLLAVKQAVALRTRMKDTLLKLVSQSAQTGEPSIRHMEYVFPRQGLAQVIDQFMVGDKVMVAPCLEKGQLSREVQFPKGTWKADDGKIIKGPAKRRIEVPLERLPYFELL